MQTKLTRKIPYWDNVKGILILVVVFGHMISCNPDIIDGFMYKFIFLFHMPLFVFCSGYLSNFNPKSTFKRLILPYFIMQFIYCLYYETNIQFVYPKKALWYLVALTFWRLFIPFLELPAKKYRPLVLIGSIILAVFAGYDKTLHTYLSTSRIIAFFPYFIFGYYLKEYFLEYPEKKEKLSERSNKNLIAKIIIAVVAVVTVGLLYKFNPDFIQIKYLYAHKWYNNDPNGAYTRIAQFICSAIIGSAILAWTPHRKTLLASFGSISMDIYLFHLFISHYIQENGLFLDMTKRKIYIISIAISVGFSLFVLLIRTIINYIKSLIKKNKTQATA